jgi:orotidine-5'-phosphate decarboxylase
VQPASPVFCALDRPDRAGALGLARAVAPHVGGLKVGLEFFAACGPEGVREVVGLGRPVFLDLKLHDIPNTVAGAVRGVCGLGVAMLTLHAAGGPAMLRAAVAAAREADASPWLLGVTVLTSLDEGDLVAVGVPGAVTDQVLRLADLAQACGLDGVICSPLELEALRRRVDPGFRLVVPGIRPAGTGAGDQKRTLGPAEALARGADVLVVGRPITAAPDPAAAAAAIAAEIAAGRPAASSGAA